MPSSRAPCATARSSAKAALPDRMKVTVEVAIERATDGLRTRGMLLRVMRIAVPGQPLSIDASKDAWALDPIDPSTAENLGVYLRSTAHGVYFNVRSQNAGRHPLTTDGMLALLREQNWGAAPFDVWTETSGDLIIVGGTFDTVGMNGEVVLEVFVTDGRDVANLAGPGVRERISAVTPAVRELARSLLFSR